MGTTPKNLQITNFKAIEFLDVDFNEHCLLLLGKNGKGKSTFLQALRIAMGIEDLPDNPVQWGKEKGKIETTFEHDGEQYSVKIAFTNDKTTFNFFDKSGAPIKKSPKSMLKQMVGPTLDIFALIEDSRTADGKRKMEKFFLEIANLDITKVEDYNKKLGASENDRLEIGRKRDLVKGVIDEFKDLDTVKYADKKELKPLYDQFNLDLKAKEQPEQAAHDLRNEKLKEVKDKAELMKQLAGVKETGIENSLLINELEELHKERESIGNEILELEKKIKERIDARDSVNQKIQLKQPIVDMLTPLSDIRKQYDAIELEIKSVDLNNETVINDANVIFADKLKAIREANDASKQALTSDLEKAVSASELHNAEHAKVLLLRERKSELEMYEDAYETLTGTIVGLREERRAYIMSGRFPVPEMEYTDAGIRYKNMPLDERSLSTSDIIELGVMLNDALNPNGLRFMPIPNASLFDKDHFARVQKYLVDHKLIGAFEMVSSNNDDLEIVFLEDPK